MNDWLSQHNSSPVVLAQAQQPAETTTTPTTSADPVESGPLIPRSEYSLYASPILVFLLIMLVVIIGTRRLKIVPRGMQNFLELVVESLNGIPEMVMGPRGRQYAPFVSTFFLYILLVNLSGLIPGLKSGTASLSITVGLGVTAFFAVQYFGFRAKGIRYLTHFIGPVPLMAFLILPLELIAEFFRPVSLSFRLYGNIFGEEQIIHALSTQFFPLVAVLMLPLQIITSVLQALVFALLVTVYIALATEEHEEHKEHAVVEETAPAH